VENEAITRKKGVSRERGAAAYRMKNLQKPARGEYGEC